VCFPPVACTSGDVRRLSVLFLRPVPSAPEVPLRGNGSACARGDGSAGVRGYGSAGARGAGRPAQGRTASAAPRPSPRVGRREGGRIDRRGGERSAGERGDGSASARGYAAAYGALLRRRAGRVAPPPGCAGGLGGRGMEAAAGERASVSEPVRTGANLLDPEDQSVGQILPCIIF
jgi:hypothetical protein